MIQFYKRKIAYLFLFCLMCCSFSTFSFHQNFTFSSSDSPPAKIINFILQSMDEAVAVKWQTSAEMNNELFTVLRSKNLTNWEVVGRLQGAGNSSKVNSYFFLDEAPLNGLGYYQLMQTDFDGKITMSDVLAINFLKKPVLQLYPNPTKQQVTVNNIQQSDFESGNLIEIINSMGSRVRIEQVQNYPSQVVNIETLRKGVYYVKIGNSKMTKLAVE